MVGGAAGGSDAVFLGVGLGDPVHAAAGRPVFRHNLSDVIVASSQTGRDTQPLGLQQRLNDTLVCVPVTHFLRALRGLVRKPAERIPTYDQPADIDTRDGDCG